MAMTNLERQLRWQAKRNALAKIVTGEPKEVAKNLTRHFGKDHAQAIAQAIIKPRNAPRAESQ
jgi:hypothetical protein